MLLVFAAAPCPAATEEGPAPERFYFLGPHLFPFDHGIAGLIPHDMDGDGDADLLLVDQRASKFHLLLQGERDEDEDWDPAFANELEPDRLIGKREVRVSETLLGHVVGDFGGDASAIVYVTMARELIVECREPEGGRRTAQRFLLELDSSFMGGFEAADLDGSGKPDVVLLAEDALLVFFQDAEGRLSAPRRYPVAKPKSAGLVLADVDNDGRSDIIYCAPSTRYPLRVRLSQADGSPGPEYRFRMPPPGDVTVGDATSDGRNEIALIESTTNRVKLLRWTPQKERPLAGTDTGALEMVPFTRDQKAKMRAFAVADVDGNGLPDVVVTDPNGARLSLIRSQPGQGLTPCESFPSLKEASALVALPGEGGAADLIVCSSKEGIVGVSRYDAETGRLEYPRPLDVGGTPHAIAAARTPSGPALLCAVRAADNAEGGDGPVELVVLERAEPGYRVAARQELDTFREPPAHLTAVDADGDGADDLIAFPEYEPPVLLMRGEDGTFTDVSQRPGFRKHMLRDLKRAAVAALPGAGH
ncbi:MAG: hypothetical protein AMK73_02120 [Planctomycetes bacterium SM23_32]|nr:MAG: hypothetical protein AMK73_02120 [Planctomycetes bacterium SM23_32]